MRSVEVKVEVGKGKIFSQVSNKNVQLTVVESISKMLIIIDEQFYHINLECVKQSICVKILITVRSKAMPAMDVLKYTKLLHLNMN